MAGAGKHEFVAVDEIELDRSNPRIRKFLEMYGDSPTPEQIFLALGAGNDDDTGGSTSTTFEKLKQSIITNGGIIQPVILNRRRDGTLVCVEGNTRVALYKHFSKTGVKRALNRSGNAGAAQSGPLVGRGAARIDARAELTTGTIANRREIPVNGPHTDWSGVVPLSPASLARNASTSASGASAHSVDAGKDFAFTSARKRVSACTRSSRTA